jgi:dTDP-L-rhamnose 4-epimerase
MKKTKGRVLISGGAGFIGSHTADLLLEKGYKVRILDNLSTKTHNGKWPLCLNKRIEKVKGDVRYKKHWVKALKGVDYVIHLAAWMDLMPEFSRFFEINVVGTSNLYELIVKHKLQIKKVVIASSQFVYGQGKYKCKRDGIVFPKDRDEKRLQRGLWDLQCPKCKGVISPLANDESHADPPNQYAISKFCQEQIALKLGKLYNIPSVALRYSIAHGSRQSIKSAYSGALKQFVLWLINGNTLLYYEDGKQLRDFVSVKDVAHANVKVIQDKRANYQVFNVGGGKNYTVKQLARMVSNEMKVNSKAEPMSSYRVGDTRHSFSSISKLGKIGWKPEVTEERNIADFVKWVKTQKGSTKALKNIQELKKIGAAREFKNQ